MFPAGDGTVNIGVGALSTMKGFKQLNLNTLLEAYRHLVQDDYVRGSAIYALAGPTGWESYEIAGPVADILRQNAFIGCGDTEAELASDYKQRLTESLTNKTDDHR